ncbi:MAG: SUMF1/EgtB/PvdO family nonheme iron enzyme [Verrucomicrobia bacterium]|nr:SUMF1/EgtB/PvdO family nonheme iron enzyme [Verrucomicrobiota bacterium]
MRPHPVLRPLATLGSVVAFTALSVASHAQTTPAPEPFTNSLGLRFVPIAAGEFVMGSTATAADPDEQPAHRVKIAAPFFISETEVTAAQVLRFRAVAELTPDYAPYAAGVSWRDAMAFCAWLSLREGRAYRLPTEAEWEYVCRAGRTDEAVAVARQSWESAPDVANPWGVKNMLSGPLEWCFDSYGDYPVDDATDPVGVESGSMRVVRGGGLDTAPSPPAASFRRPSNRAAAPPRFGPYFDGMPNPQSYGLHQIGFRLVFAPLLKTKPQPVLAPFVRQGVKPLIAAVMRGPDPAEPYLRLRRLPLAAPAVDQAAAVRSDDGASTADRGSLSLGFDVLPNGDALLVFARARREFDPATRLLAARLRFGADQWDLPSVLLDTPDAADQAPLLWHDREKLWLFWAHPYAEGHFPFHYITSRDFGLTWSDVTFPHITGPLGPALERPQPLNSVVVDDSGAIYLAAAAAPGGPLGVQSMLWTTRSGGTAWHDTTGRTFGRHTAFALTRDGAILGLGGSDSQIGKSLPRALSRDRGQSYELSSSSLPPLERGQSPGLLRLASGRLFFAGEFQPSKSGSGADSIRQDGRYVALSEDDGDTWRWKRLPEPSPAPRTESGAGNSVARQAPNGLVHLLATSGAAALHYEMNEAWILSEATFADGDPTVQRSRATTIAAVEGHADIYAAGKPHILWSLGTADDGRVLLEGIEIWHHANGTKQREATYVRGVKIGHEAYWSPEGIKLWEWLHHADGTSHHKACWPDGTPRAESTWKNFELVPGTEKFFERGVK